MLRRDFLGLRYGDSLPVPKSPTDPLSPGVVRVVEAICEEASFSRSPFWAAALPARIIEPSVAQHVATQKRHGPKIGSIVDPFRERIIRFESGLEEKVIYCLIASPWVREIREQQRIVYRHGLQRETVYVDLLVDWTSGTRSVLEVKYEKDVQKSGVKERLIELEACVGDAVADRWVLVTERTFSDTNIANAKEVHRCGTVLDIDGQSLVRRFLSLCEGAVTFGDVKRVLGDRGYRAAVALIQAGEVDVPNGHRIDLDCDIVCHPARQSA